MTYITEQDLQPLGFCWQNSWRHDRKQGERGGVTCSEEPQAGTPTLAHGTLALPTKLNSTPRLAAFLCRFNMFRAICFVYLCTDLSLVHCCCLHLMEDENSRTVSVLPSLFYLEVTGEHPRVCCAGQQPTSLVVALLSFIGLYTTPRSRFVG